MKTLPIKALCVSDYYLPGFKGGGPIRTLANMRKILANHVEIAIFTRDRDLGAEAPYEGICANEWLETEAGPVFYADPATFNARGLKRALAGRDFDILYLNSFFSRRASIELIFAFRQSSRILLAPRGEFSPGALTIKGFKKRVFLALVRALGLYRGVYWHASTEMEKQDILRQFPQAERMIHLAEDPIDIGFTAVTDSQAPPKQAGTARLAFISRISPKKNLDGLLRILATVKHPVTLEVFGPIEDEAHWQACQQLIKALPDHITATYQGAVAPDEVSPIFARFDLFAFPTHGENFGHVIFEALRAGTPVLVSDQTPWKTDPSGAVTALSLGDGVAWRREIEAVAGRAAQPQARLRMATLEFAQNYALKNDTKENNFTMFQKVASYAI